MAAGYRGTMSGADFKALSAGLKEHAPDVVPIMNKHMKDIAGRLVKGGSTAAWTIRFETVGVETKNAGDGRIANHRRVAANREAAARRVESAYTRNLATAATTGKKLVKTRKRWEALVAKHGLRAQIAKGVRSSQTTTKTQITLSVRTWKAPAFVTSQTSSGRYASGNSRSVRNQGLWRHPVFGNERVWVSQRIKNSFWWDQGIREGTDDAVREIEAAFDEWVTLLAALVERAAKS